LHEFDLLIIDGDVLKTLGRAETDALSRSVKNGMGTIVLFNENPSGRRKVNILPFSFKPHASDTAHIASENAIVLPVWPVIPTAGESIIPVVRNKNRILSGYHHFGLGKAGFQLLQETYSLSLKGDSIGYSKLWSSLIEQTSRSNENKSAISLQTTFPVFAEDPVMVQIISSTAEPKLFYQEQEIPLQENVLVDDVWTTKLWTDRPGWHKLMTNDSAQFDFYVSENNEWRSLDIANRIRQTELLSSRPPTAFTSTETFKDPPQWIFLVLFLTTAGFLWIAPKL
jgi:hypothetical protein